MKPTILLVGFEPWGPYNSNPAQDIARALHGSDIAGYEVHGVSLPIDFTEFRTKLEEVVAAHQPAIVYGIGMDFKDADVLHIETEARQQAHYGEFQDKNGVVAGDVLLDERSETLTLPNRELVEKVIAETDLPVELSTDASRHMCESVLRDLIRMSDDGKNFLPGFIHVPHTSDQLEDSRQLQEHTNAMPLETQIQIVRQYLVELIRGSYTSA